MDVGIRRYQRKRGGFTTVANSFARSTLSARAIKVGLFILSHMDGFAQTQEQISRAIKMSVRTVAEALTDLEEAGLLIRHEVRNERGYRVGTMMDVSDEPFTEQERADLQQSPTADSAGGVLSADSASADFAGHKKTIPSKKTKKDSSPPDGGGLFDVESNNGSGREQAAAHLRAAFEAFWSVYPRKIAKADAEKAFRSACKIDVAAKITLGAKRYAEYIAAERTEAKYVAYPASWLRAGRWTDELPVPVTTSSMPLITDNWD